MQWGGGKRRERDSLVSKTSSKHGFKHDVAEGFVVAQVDFAKAPVVQRFFLDEIGRSHVERSVGRGGHCDAGLESCRDGDDDDKLGDMKYEVVC